MFVEHEKVSGHWWAEKHMAELQAQESDPTSPPVKASSHRDRPRSPPARAKALQRSSEARIIEVAAKAAAATVVVMSEQQMATQPKRWAVEDRRTHVIGQRKRKVDDLIRAVERASQAAGKATRICEQARIAFEAEKTNLENALVEISASS